ncbi:hypothetical protein BS47DRAFT_1365998 [Hydnum rufescens UP504]|uniref:Uncharacterized protein n=1 Tax=Hydnum rufescens UP504 TaxID=1448309 RepID=A0A9P6DNW8_9AGAM|nr:hypothetical protein BS47DRAFT_1365998 [Hydnum rufescens UP504]
MPNSEVPSHTVSAVVSELRNGVEPGGGGGSGSSGLGQLEGLRPFHLAWQASSSWRPLGWGLHSYVTKKGYVRKGNSQGSTKLLNEEKLSTGLGLESYRFLSGNIPGFQTVAFRLNASKWETGALNCCSQAHMVIHILSHLKNSYDPRLGTSSRVAGLLAKASRVAGVPYGGNWIHFLTSSPEDRLQGFSKSCSTKWVDHSRPHGFLQLWRLHTVAV